MIGNVWLHHLVTGVVAIITIAIFREMGRLGTVDQHTGTALAHALIIVLASYPLQTLFAVSFMRAGLVRLSTRVAAILGCVLAAIPASLIAPVASWFAGVLPRDLPADAGRQAFIDDLLSRYPYLLIGYGVIGTAFWMALNYGWWQARLADKGDATGASDDDDDGQDAPREAVLLAKLPIDKRGQILALSAEKHYVRVITDRGEDLVLMRFADAVALCGKLGGLQVHRSHWVRRAAIREVRKRDGGGELHLVTGHRLPVSRSYTGTLKDLAPAV